MSWLYNGQPITGQITINDTQYPTGWPFDTNPVEGVTWQDPPPPPEPELPYVPQSVSRRQGKLILLQYGLLDAIEAVVATLDRSSRINYEDAQTFDRTNPVLLYVAAQAGMSDTTLDEMFTAAALL